MAGAGRAIACVAALVAVALVLFLAFRGPGGTHPPAAAGRAAAGLGGTSPASTARSGTAVSAEHADPLSGAAAAYAASRSGSVLAAVYDVSTGQSWRLGDGPAQPAASVVKLDILETLLAKQAGTTLSAGDRSLSRVDDRGQRQRRRHQPVGRGRRGGGHRGLQRQRRALRDDAVGVRDVRRVRLAGLGADDDGPAGPADPAEAAHRAGTAPAAVGRPALLRAVPDGEHRAGPALGGLAAASPPASRWR